MLEQLQHLAVHIHVYFLKFGYAQQLASYHGYGSTMTRQSQEVRPMITLCLTYFRSVSVPDILSLNSLMSLGPVFSLKSGL